MNPATYYHPGQLVYHQPSPNTNLVPLMPSPGANIISLPNHYVSAGHSPGQMTHALPTIHTGHATQYITAGAPSPGYYGHGPSPLMPMMSLPQHTPYPAMQKEPQMHYSLAVPGNKVPLVVWDIFQPTSSLLAASQSFPIYPTLSAIEPPVYSLRIVCKDMPWMIRIKKREKEGFITVGDIFEAIYLQMQEQIIHSEWRLMSPKTQKYVISKYNQRVAAEKATAQYHNQHQPKQEQVDGIKRVDYLLDRVGFVGLKQDPETVKELCGDIDVHDAWLLVLSERRH